jgi:hypothetical protein
LVTGPAVVLPTSLGHIRELADAFSLPNLLRDLEHEAASKTRAGRHITAAEDNANSIVRFLSENRKQQSQQVVQAAVNHLTHWAVDKFRGAAADALTSIAVRALNAVGVEDATGVVDALSPSVGPLVAAAQLYILALEITGAVAFVKRYGHIWYGPSQASNTNKTFLMAVFVGASPQPQPATPATGATPTTPPTTPRKPGELLPQTRPAPGSALSSSPIRGAFFVPATSAGPSTKNGVVLPPAHPSATGVDSSASLYGNAWFYWKTP